MILLKKLIFKQLKVNNNENNKFDIDNSKKFVRKLGKSKD